MVLLKGFGVLALILVGFAVYLLVTYTVVTLAQALFGVVGIIVAVIALFMASSALADRYLY